MTYRRTDKPKRAVAVWLAVLLLCGLCVCARAADSAGVNDDGSVDLRDAVILKRYLAGGWDVVLL